MIILDTNVVSEALRMGRSPNVVGWMNKQSIDTLYLTATSLAELLIGVEILPDGKRKKGLGTALGELLLELFGSRILSFDRQTAMAYAYLVGHARRNGNAISMPDGQIAAIAYVHGFTVATRDIAPFAACGIPTVNPWI